MQHLLIRQIFIVYPLYSWQQRDEQGIPGLCSEAPVSQGELDSAHNESDKHFEENKTDWYNKKLTYNQGWMLLQIGQSEISFQGDDF